jgi:RNA-directed DNA polymerase
MKTYKRLYPRLCSFENLYDAFLKARKGKRSRPDVATFEFNLEFELPQLQEELESETYRPVPGHRHPRRMERPNM